MIMMIKIMNTTMIVTDDKDHQEKYDQNKNKHKIDYKHYFLGFLAHHIY